MLIILVVPIGVFDISVGALSEGYYTYEVYNDEVTITGVDTSISGDITIPDTLGGYPVRSIGFCAFYNCDGLTNVTILDNITIIDIAAFRACYSLASVTIGNSVTSIADDAFYDTGFYNDDNNWQNNVLYIGKHLIEAKSDISGDYTIKSGILTVAHYAFSWCDNLTSITIPDSVTSIGNSAFVDCTSLTSVYYRGSLEEKNKITIGPNNAYLENATWHYNSCINTSSHTYDNACDTDCNICGKIRTTNHVYDDEEDTTCNICGFEKPKYISGDINNDTQINNKDLGLLMQYLNNWEVEINVDAADVNDDGSVNNKDYGLLMQYLNGWGVKLQ